MDKMLRLVLKSVFIITKNILRNNKTNFNMRLYDFAETFRAIYEFSVAIAIRFKFKINNLEFIRLVSFTLKYIS